MKIRTMILMTILVLLVPVLSVSDERANISIINVYDNYSANPELENRKGFGCVIITPEVSILFDTGAYHSGPTLLSNIEKMDINPDDIDIIVNSHEHLIGGLDTFLKDNGEVKVFVPTGFPDFIRPKVEQYGAEYFELREFTEITENVYCTGAMEGQYAGKTIPEQALVLDTDKGLVVIVGCAHPGIVDMLEAIIAEFPDNKIYLAMGGFHLRSLSESESESVINDFKRLGVMNIVPTHCSGDTFRRVANEKYKSNYIEGGVGHVISF